jgi:hypothetical protein
VTNTEKLNIYIQASGLKKSYIAMKLGINPATLARKINSVQEFRAREITALCELLDIKTLAEKEAIFFASEVAKTATK